MIDDNALKSSASFYLKTCDISAEERSKLSSTPSSLTLVTQLVIQHIGLHLDLNKHSVKSRSIIFACK